MYHHCDQILNHWNWVQMRKKCCFCYIYNVLFTLGELMLSCLCSVSMNALVLALYRIWCICWKRLQSRGFSSRICWKNNYWRRGIWKAEKMWWKYFFFTRTKEKVCGKFYTWMMVDIRKCFVFSLQSSLLFSKLNDMYIQYI